MNPRAAIVARLQRRPSVAILVGVPLIAAVLGGALALALRDDGDSAPNRAAPEGGARSFAAGDLRFALPEGWRQVKSGPAVPGFDPAHTTFVSSLSSDVAVALLAPQSPTLLPAALARRQHAGALRPRVARAGRVRAYHYVTALGANRVIDIYTTPTTRGTATVACSTTVYELGECQTVVGALRLVSGSFLPLSANSAFLERLPAVVAKLNAERTALRARLTKATTPVAGARVATRLAAAYAATGRALRPLLGADGPARDTVRLLDRLRAEHLSLAAAIAIQDRVSFARATGTIASHEARLARSLATWQRSLPR